ncbi:MAG: tagaturonate epimerase family protein [Kiritimatiellia bacterium]|nr:tagaturonate epimerase family protein [Kiritimatiellia bacterium]
MKIAKYSMGIGDRFAHQGKAQLKAFLKAKELEVEIAPVWNKSNREHRISHTVPGDVRKEADAAVKALGWREPYFVDADHISLKNVDGFIAASDFFTLDVADFIGKSAEEPEIKKFADKYAKTAKNLDIPGIDENFDISKNQIREIARKYLLAVREAGEIYKKIESVKGKDNFVTEVSMDETDTPQTPVEMLFILAAVADEKIPAQTIAPKFIGRFNKGIDYAGDVTRFEKEFNQDLLVIAFAAKEFSLPQNLKLSVHSGSDKFSIYAPIRKALKKHGAGLHLKTAGTTWLEEVTGLAEAGGEGLEIAKEIYINALGRFNELCAPYTTVIDARKDRLPSAGEVKQWHSARFTETLRHDKKCGAYNPDFRQLIHVGYKVAVEMGPRYYAMLEKFEEIIGKNVAINIFDRHLKPVFIN